jgi:hypothetical protein
MKVSEVPMNRVIYKYTIPYHESEITISMPFGAEILSVQEQHGDISVWALVKPDLDLIDDRTFHVLTTGETENFNGMRFLGTVQFDKGTNVLHVFEKGEAR